MEWPPGWPGEQSGGGGRWGLEAPGLLGAVSKVFFLVLWCVFFVLFCGVFCFCCVFLLTGFLELCDFFFAFGFGPETPVLRPFMGCFFLDSFKQIESLFGRFFGFLGVWLAAGNGGNGGFVVSFASVIKV